MQVTKPIVLTALLIVIITGSMWRVEAGSRAIGDPLDPKILTPSQTEHSEKSLVTPKNSPETPTSNEAGSDAERAAVSGGQVVTYPRGPHSFPGPRSFPPWLDLIGNNLSPYIANKILSFDQYKILRNEAGFLISILLILAR